MVQFNELRVGNFVHVGNGVYERVLEILCDSITTETKQGIFDFDGIPFTPEILEKAGFEWSIYHQAFWNKSFGYKVNWWSVGQGVDILLTLEKRINIEYLHQFQNLYFALTGEELQIEL